MNILRSTYLFLSLLNASYGELPFPNAGAEQGDLSNWEILYHSGGSAHNDNGGVSDIYIENNVQNVSEGNFSFQLSAGSSVTHVLMRSKTRTLIQAGKEYRISFDLKYNSGDINKFRFYYVFYDSELGGLSYGGNGSWSPVDNRFNYHLLRSSKLEDGYTRYDFQVYIDYFGSDNSPVDSAYMEIYFQAEGSPTGLVDVYLDNLCISESFEILLPKITSTASGWTFGDWFYTQIKWDALGSYDYTIQRSSDLSQWDDIQTLSGEWDEMMFTDYTQTPESKQFYRIQTKRK